MEHRKQSNGWPTFLEHWWFALIAVMTVVASQALVFFTQLQGAPWINFLIVSFALLIFGGSLIGCA
jgi:hypothetical protein